MTQESWLKESWDDARRFLRFARGLPRYLASPLSPPDCHRIVEEGVRDRARNFLATLRGGVFENADSPLLALLKNAGVEPGDVERLVESGGIEDTLDRLFDAGVFVTLEEAKGLQPIRRGSFRLNVVESDFDNPMLPSDLRLSTGGSTGRPRRLLFGFDSLTFDAAHRGLFYMAHDLDGRPSALWRPPPPGAAGLVTALFHAKRDESLDRWFSPLPIEWSPSSAKSHALTAYSVLAGRFRRRRVPWRRPRCVRSRARCGRRRSRPAPSRANRHPVTR